MTLEDFDPPDRFVAGTVGPPGGRTFFLQARRGRRLVSVSLEKQQVAVLADRVGDLLDQVAAPAEAAVDRPVVVEDNEPLDTPIEDEFRVNTLSLAWDEGRSVLIIEALDRDPEEAPDAEATTPVDVPQLIRVVLAPSVAREFARRCGALVAAGRPPCPFCGGPLEVEGHICPRANGYKR